MSARQSLDIRELPWMRPLALDYAVAYEKVAAFFPGFPGDPDAWRAVIARVQGRDRNPAVVDALAAQIGRRGSIDAVAASVQRLRDPRAVAVLTGQQAGLFGGPLYTLLKALAAVLIAERVTREHGVPAVPIFWIDAEDHDWDEVASCTVLGEDFHPRPVTLPRMAHAGERAVAGVVLDERIAETVDALGRALAPTEFTPALLEGVQAAYRPGLGMADAFARWLERVMGPHGLVVYDCSDPATKPFVGELFVRELRDPVTASLAAKAGAALERAGYHTQVTVGPDTVGLFYLDSGRTAIRRARAGFTVGERMFPAEALIEEARATPERFSPNVLLRPIVQDWLFPTVCYIGGPNELAYLGQLGDVYTRFDVPRPLVLLRPSATILDSASSRFLHRYAVPLASLQPQNESALNRLLEQSLPPGVDAALVDARLAVEDRMARVIDAVPTIDPTLEGAARSTVGRMLHDLDTLHNKIIQAAKRRDETLRRQFTRAQALAFPGGQPQERTLAFVHFVNQFGPSLVDVLRQELSLDPGQHSLLTL